MRCLFCKKDSSGSRSVEHILPESIGNTSQILPRGVVCDQCNNYFSREVERPFLELSAIRLIRFHQAVPSKRGLVPTVAGLLSPDVPVIAERFVKGPLAGAIALPPEAIEELMKNGGGTLLLPAEAPLPSDSVVSRFLAKVGLEVMAQRLVEHPNGLDYLVGEEQLDPIRNHARRGDTREWPTSSRRIYNAERQVTCLGASDVQVVHEYDLLVTSSSEYFFVMAIFGLELAINLGGPEITGYNQWLAEHNNESPLYCGKNADIIGSPPRQGGNVR